MAGHRSKLQDGAEYDDANEHAIGQHAIKAVDLVVDLARANLWILK